MYYNLRSFQFKFIVACLSFFIFCNCVSVNIAPNNIHKADNLKFNEPGSGFEKFSSAAADKAWQNPKFGNSISFLTTCNDSNDPSLEVISNELLMSLGDYKIIKSDKTTASGREALQVTAETSIEGIPTKIEYLVFKKNSCSFTLSYVATSKHFNQFQDVFQNFIKSFEVP